MTDLWLTNALGDRCQVFWLDGWDRTNLCVELQPGATTHVALGWVRCRHDGRWEWTFRPDRNGLFTPVGVTEKAQGVEATKVAARWRLVEIWTGKRVEDL